MSEPRYEQKGTDIIFKGKRVVSCYGTNDDMNESESEAFNMAEGITQHLNQWADTLEFWENIEKKKGG